MQGLGLLGRCLGKVRKVQNCEGEIGGGVGTGLREMEL